jgi:hypothetical protein
MSYAQIPGVGLFGGLPVFTWTDAPGAGGLLLIDATGEKIAVGGRFWHKSRGTRTVTRLGWRFGSVTKAGGSGLTASLQDLLKSSGTGMIPDETQDQTVAVANGDAAFASNTWYRSGTLSGGGRTLAFGEEVAFVLEYDGSGRLGSDSVVMSTMGAQVAHNVLCNPVLKTGGSWARQGQIPNLVLECDDGSFGTIMGCVPWSAFNTHAYKQDTGGADEYAAVIRCPFPCKVDAAWAMVNKAALTSDYDIVLYDGTSAITGGTISVDGNLYANAWNLVALPFSQEIELEANHDYYLALKPTQTTSNITAYSFDVDDPGHFDCWPGGSDNIYTTRLDGGSWAASTATRRLMAGVCVSSVADGGGGGGLLRPVAMLGGMAL